MPAVGPDRDDLVGSGRCRRRDGDADAEGALAAGLPGAEHGAARLVQEQGDRGLVAEVTAGHGRLPAGGGAGRGHRDLRAGDHVDLVRGARQGEPQAVAGEAAAAAGRAPARAAATAMGMRPVSTARGGDAWRMSSLPWDPPAAAGHWEHAGRQRRSRLVTVASSVGQGTSLANQYASTLGMITRKIAIRP